MKKVVIIVMSLFLCACSGKEILTNTGIDISKKSATSDKIIVEVESKLNNLKYKLYKDKDVITEGDVTKEMTFEDLKKDTTYKLEIYNNDVSEEKKLKTNDTIILRFGGDTTISDSFGTYTDRYGINYMWDEISELTKSADYMVVNLETSVSERGASTKPEGYGFRSNPSHLQGFINAGVDMVTLGNNHVLDYGYEAFLDTLTNLDDYNIKYIGAGKTYKEASTVKYVEIKGIKIGFLDATNIIPKSSWVATTDSGGVMPFNDAYYEKIYAIVKKANSECDMLIMLLHWGTEYNNMPTTTQVNLAHKLVDLGVDVLVGGHPHVLQGIEYYKEAQIFYSLGNFVFYKGNDDAGLTGLFEVEIDNEKIVSSQVYPISIDDCKAKLLTSKNSTYNNVITNLNNRSLIFKTSISNQGKITKIDN